METAWSERFRALLPPEGRVLDLGCGHGEPWASHLTELGFQVTGVDGAAAMIELCKHSMPEGDWRQADMRGLDLGVRFHGILAWDSFFHLSADEQRAMFPVFKRHSLPGAALLFSSGPAEGEALGEMAGEALYHASLAPEEYRHLLKVQGFVVVEHVAEDPECV